MNEGGQGALEYILMIALMLAAVSFMIIFFVGKPTKLANKSQRGYNITNDSIEAILHEAR